MLPGCSCRRHANSLLFVNSECHPTNRETCLPRVEGTRASATSKLVEVVSGRSNSAQRRVGRQKRFLQGHHLMQMANFVAQVLTQPIHSTALMLTLVATETTVIHAGRSFGACWKAVFFCGSRAAKWTRISTTFPHPVGDSA